MTKKNPGEDALIAVTAIGNELSHLVEQLRQHKNVAFFYEQLDRWRDRGVATLDIRVSAAEATKLRDLPSRPVFLFHPPDDVVAGYSRFLAALQQEIAEHPNNFPSLRAAKKQRRFWPAPWPPLERPERITPAWIWRHGDAKWAFATLVAFLVSLYGAFVFGVHASRNPDILRVLAPFLQDSSLTHENGRTHAT